MYSHSRRVLRVTFHNGLRYEYAVPPEAWETIKTVEHPGQWLRTNILPNIKGKRVTE